MASCSLGQVCNIVCEKEEEETIMKEGKKDRKERKKRRKEGIMHRKRKSMIEGKEGE